MFKFRIAGRILSSGFMGVFFLIASFFTLVIAITHFNVMVLLGFAVAVIWTKLGFGKKNAKR